MIPHAQIESDSSDWNTQLRTAVTSPAELLSLLGLSGRDEGALAACRDFPLLVPRSFISRMEHGNLNDPLLRQVLPIGAEMLAEPGYTMDPVGETGIAISRRGIIQKYRGRVLLLLASGCAVNCRYCFRRHFPYRDNQNSRAEWLQAIEHIASDNSISEVILSGGDPFLVADGGLRELVSRVAAVPQVRRLRVHTRLPVVIPARVTAGLVDALDQPNLDTVIVLHSNHANELSGEVASALGPLRECGFTLLNQAVLLAGVNDTAEALVALSERLFELGILPYYLHLLDKVRGAAHFDVDEARGRILLGEISARLPGYLVPKLVREIAGETSKTSIAPVFPASPDILRK